MSARLTTDASSPDVAVEPLEHVRCDLCGADDPEPFLELRDLMFRTTCGVFTLVRCRSCGLLYLNPRPPNDALGQFYRGDYAPFARSGVAARAKRSMIKRDVNALWPVLGPPARVIDVGCATGELLGAIKERGNSNLAGIEPNPHAASIARERHALEVVTGTLEGARLASESVDTALLAHTIEHLPSPAQTLAELSRILRPGGTFVLWLPNANSFAAKVLRRYWIGYDAPRHLFDFSPQTLTRLLDKHRFEVCSVRHERVGLEWSWGLRLIARERLQSRRIDQGLAALHPALTLALSPLSTGAALCRKAGRIRVVATKRR